VVQSQLPQKLSNNYYEGGENVEGENDKPNVPLTEEKKEENVTKEKKEEK